MSYIDEMDAVDAEATKNLPKKNVYNNYIEEMDAIDREAASPEVNKQITDSVVNGPKSNNFIRLIGENLASGTLSIADIPQSIIGLLGQGIGALENSGFISDEDKMFHQQGHSVGQTLSKIGSTPGISKNVIGGLKNIGVDLESEVPNSPEARIVKNIAQFVGATVGSGGAGAAAKLAGSAKNIPSLIKAGKLLGAPSSLSEAASMIGLGGAVGGASGVAQEVGVNPLIADIGSSLATPLAVSALKGGLSGIGNAGKLALNKSYRDKSIENSATKEASEYLQDLVGKDKLDEVLSNIRSYESPIGYQGTTAEKSKNVKLAQLERSKQGHIEGISEQRAIDNEKIREALDNIAPGVSDILSTKQHLTEISKDIGKSATEAVEEFSHKVGPEEAGKDIRDYLSKKLKSLEKERTEITSPLYKKVEEISEGIKPSKTHELINKEMELARKGTPLMNNLKKIKLMLEPNSKKMPSNVSIGGEKITSPKLLEKINAGSFENNPKPIELTKTINEIDDMIGKAKSIGSKNRARTLMEIKNSILEDMSHIPEEKAARKAYAELSKPISDITEHRSIGKIVKKDKFNKEYVLTNAEVPSKVINKSMASIEDSRDLLNRLGNDKKTIQSIEGYINNQVINNITDSFGNIDIKRLDKWKKENPGAFEIYPRLQTKIGNLQNAKHMANQVKGNNIKDTDNYFKGAFQAFSGENPDSYVKNLLSGSGKMDKVKKAIELSSSDPTGAALEGLKRGFIDDMQKSINLSSFDSKGIENLSYDKFKKYLRKNRNELNVVFDSDQMKVLDSIEESLKRRAFATTAGSSIGSPTASNLTILDFIQSKSPARKILGHVAGADIILDAISGFIQKSKIHKKNQLIEQALTDPEMAKFLLTPVSDKPGLEKFSDYLKNRSYLAIPPVSLQKHEETEKND